MTHTLKELADIGAAAASGNKCYHYISVSEKAHSWIPDEPARQAFAQAVRDAVLNAVLADTPTPPESTLLPQLHPISKAGPVPDGCVRVYMDRMNRLHDTDYGERCTHFTDIRLPVPAVATDPYAELKAAHAAGKVIQTNVGKLCNPEAEDLWEERRSPAWNLELRFYRIKPDSSPTFESHGLTWTRHKPGNPMPCDGEALVNWLTRLEIEGAQYVHSTMKASNLLWSAPVSWRYAEPTLPVTKIVPLDVGDIRATDEFRNISRETIQTAACWDKDVVKLAHSGRVVYKVLSTHYLRRQHGSTEWKPCTKEVTV